jgi:hypothetical protein
VADEDCIAAPRAEQQELSHRQRRLVRPLHGAGALDLVEVDDVDTYVDRGTGWVAWIDRHAGASSQRSNLVGRSRLSQLPLFLLRRNGRLDLLGSGEQAGGGAGGIADNPLHDSTRLISSIIDGASQASRVAGDFVGA